MMCPVSFLLNINYFIFNCHQANLTIFDEILYDR